MPIAEMKVGPYVAADGAQIVQRASRDSSTVVMDAHARYQEAVFRGNVFSAANNSSQPLTASAASMTGNILYNPIASGKNLVVWDIEMSLTSVIGNGTASSQAIVLVGAVGPNVAAPTSPTKLTPVNNLLNGAVSAVAQPYGSASFTGVTPVVIRPLASIVVVGTTGVTAALIPPIKDEIAGAVIVPPGAYVAVSFVGGAAPSFITNITWEEIPI